MAHLSLNLLLSAKVAKFLKIPPANLEHTSNFEEIEDHWTSFWRCEVMARVENSENLILLCTNHRTGYSFVISTPPNLEMMTGRMFDGLFHSLKRFQIPPPGSNKAEYSLLRGQARSLTGFQNQRIPEVLKILKTIHDPIHLMKVINGLPTRYIPEVFPDAAFEKHLENDPLFKKKPPPTATTRCPCQSGLGYADCCHPFLEGLETAKNAEQLTRSRYTAYFSGNTDYLLKTTHPKMRSPGLRQKIEEIKQSTKWLGLKLISMTQGGIYDKQGKVVFRAEALIHGTPQTLTVHARFRRYEGRWMYWDAKG